MSRARRCLLAGLVLLMAGSGILHLRNPEPYVRIVPKMLGDPEFWVFWSGILEIIAGGLLTVSRTRRLGAALTIAILIAVFPANVQMAIDGGQPGGGWYAGSTPLLWLRLPLQGLLVLWAWTFVRRPQVSRT